MNGQGAPFLFSVDLEDLRTMFEGGDRFAERVPRNTERYLRFLSDRGARCTFFVVGDIVRRYPELVREIASEGHELAWHSSDHTPLVQLDAARFRDELARARDELGSAGAQRVVGYRAPSASLVAETRWAYGVLAELGYRYSSSVLAARNPLYGWPEFGPDRARRVDGVWELPISLTALPGLRVPFASGVYLRVLPLALIRRSFREHASGGQPVVGYVHPYDIDVGQERFMHPQIGQNRLYNWLMYRNRAGALARLDELLSLGSAILPYAQYVDTLPDGASAGG